MEGEANFSRNWIMLVLTNDVNDLLRFKGKGEMPVINN